MKRHYYLTVSSAQALVAALTFNAVYSSLACDGLWMSTAGEHEAISLAGYLLCEQQHASMAQLCWIWSLTFPANTGKELRQDCYLLILCPSWPGLVWVQGWTSLHPCLRTETWWMAEVAGCRAGRPRSGCTKNRAQRCSQSTRLLSELPSQSTFSWLFAKKRWQSTTMLPSTLSLWML